MSISVKNLNQLIMNTIQQNDEITIISGFFSVDIIENIAKTGKPFHGIAQLIAIGDIYIVAWFAYTQLAYRH